VGPPPSAPDPLSPLSDRGMVVAGLGFPVRGSSWEGPMSMAGGRRLSGGGSRHGGGGIEGGEARCRRRRMATGGKADGGGERLSPLTRVSVQNRKMSSASG
jgi:hypothetical protein